ncbi:MAG: AbrB/MazE/SpoVT family DNA-binding domain-containing protein [Candidatus Acidulodesulfobacterium acidiphilum]|jgi:SpoVT / AbrB like domain.|uniref:AbrB/MazE/SpoVT family DNA-binding domain-containing protein n=1 Tax=Candidatus Acidulodesulfobacterium acidiphilum TaxID=2597224 RepID=A0A520XBY8_9DELT|nr:MAG: AbrB/MazE/SpoVT family DNA-binding domain-containing protein [Candidatus Acidulodesulfobacterium acidiphilum]
MKLNIITIGNSKGIRIPSAILKQCNIEKELDLEVKDNEIILKPAKNKPRDGWDNAFKLMRRRNDDALIIDDALDLDGEENWEWK